MVKHIITGYELVQYSAGGQELLRWGVLPLFDPQPNHHPEDAPAAGAAHGHGLFRERARWRPRC